VKHNVYVRQRHRPLHIFINFSSIWRYLLSIIIGIF